MTLEPLRGLRYPPLKHGACLLDGLSLADCLCKTGQFENPSTRQRLSRDDCVFLDLHLARHRLPGTAGRCTAAFDAAAAARSAKEAARANARAAERAETEAALRNSLSAAQLAHGRVPTLAPPRLDSSRRGVLHLRPPSPPPSEEFPALCSTRYTPPPCPRSSPSETQHRSTSTRPRRPAPLSAERRLSRAACASAEKMPPPPPPPPPLLPERHHRRSSASRPARWFQRRAPRRRCPEQCRRRVRR